MTRRRLLTLGHSYVVALNRRLAHELVRAGGEAWDITAVAPPFFRGDLRPIALERLDPEPVNLEVVPARLTSSVHAFFYARDLRSILGRGWDLVHCWEEPYVVAGGQVAWWTPRAARLVFFTAQNLLKRYPPPFSWIERYVVERSAGWTPCGRTVAETLLKRPGYADRPHEILPLGVDVRAFAPSPERSASVRRSLAWERGGPPVVGYLGRFVPEKGVLAVQRALESVTGPWRALFVGGGPLERDLREWGARFGDRVRVVTGVAHDEVPGYLNAMDLLCAPSLTTPTWREQQGRMLIEAFASGVPVIGSDSGEIPHVLADAALVAREGDALDLARAIESLVGDPKRREDLSSRGLERAHGVYSWSVIARRYLEFFARVLDSTP